MNHLDVDRKKLWGTIQKTFKSLRITNSKVQANNELDEEYLQLASSENKRDADKKRFDEILKKRDNHCRPCTACRDLRLLDGVAKCNAGPGNVFHGTASLRNGAGEHSNRDH